MATRRELAQYPRPLRDNRPQARCVGCGREPKEIPEYDPDATSDPYDTDAARMTPDDYVWAQEGTLNHTNGHFACTECYLLMGEPTDPFGWVAD